MSRLITNAIRSTSASADAITFDNSGKPAFPNGGAGKILQVLQTVKTDVFNTVSTSFIDLTGMSVAITPSNTSNKVLINVALNYGGSTNLYAGINLLRGSTIVTQATDVGNNNTECTFGVGGDNENFRYKVASATYTFLDSPNTTSATTYKLQVRVSASDKRFMLNAPLDGGYDTDTGVYIMRGTSTITVMEVAA